MKVEDIKVTPTLMNESENPLTLAIDNFWKEGTDELEDGKTLKDAKKLFDETKKELEKNNKFGEPLNLE